MKRFAGKSELLLPVAEDSELQVEEDTFSHDILYIAYGVTVSGSHSSFILNKVFISLFNVDLKQR